jgi:hypothetical protein
LAGLSIVAIAAYAACKAVSFYRERILKRRAREDTTAADLLCSFAVQDSGERFNS